MIFFFFCFVLFFWFDEELSLLFSSVSKLSALLLDYSLFGSVVLVLSIGKDWYGIVFSESIQYNQN